jgi:hypothetical protein
MKKFFHFITTSIAIAAIFLAAAFIPGCGGGKDGDNNNGGSTTPPVVRQVPVSLETGAVITFEGVQLSVMGAASVDYQNSGRPANAFTNFLNGAGYTYVPTEATATLRLTGTGDTDGKIFSGSTNAELKLSGFEKAEGRFTGCTVTVSGQSFHATFTGTALLDGSGTGGTPTDPPASGDTLPDSTYIGNYNFTFILTQGENLPYAPGEVKHIEIRAPSILQVGGKIMTNAKVNTPSSVQWTDGELTFLVHSVHTVERITVLKNGNVVGVFAEASFAVTPVPGEPVKPLSGKVHIVVCTENTVFAKENYSLKNLAIGTVGEAIYERTDLEPASQYKSALHMFCGVGLLADMNTTEAVQDFGWGDTLDGTDKRRQDRTILYLDVAKQELIKVETFTRYLRDDGSVEDEYHQFFTTIGITTKSFMY